jgi:tetratricopeptide (TPR) repeat protein
MPKHDKSRRSAKSASAEPTPWHERFRSPPLLCLLLALVTFAVYTPALRNDFVNYDDSDYVTANPHVQSGLNWENIQWAFTTGHASNWHPITWLSHMLDCQLFGQQPAMHHLVSVLFHIANAVLLFLLLNGMTGAVWRSVIVAALFALHPLHVESVAWASERKDVLSAFFFLLTLIAYSRSRRGNEAVITPATKSASLPRRLPLGSALSLYFLALLFFALGLMSKPMLVTLPFVLVLLDYWPLRRFQLATFNLQRSTLLRLILEKIPFLALSVASCVITFLVQRKGGAVSTTISFGARAANAVVSYVHYVLDMFWPNHLSVLYPHPGTWPALQVVASAIFLLLVTVAVVSSVFNVWSPGFSRRDSQISRVSEMIAEAKSRPPVSPAEAGTPYPGHPYLLVGWFWFLGMLVPAIGFIQVGIQCRADRYTYLPLIGLFIMIPWGAADLLAHFSEEETDESSSSLSPRVRGNETLASPRLSEASLVFVNGLCLFAFTACAVVTSRQISYWRNSETLFRRAVQVTQKNYLAYNNLGFYLSNRGEVAEAMENYRKSLEINPNYEDAHNNLGYAYAGQKKYPEAIAEYEAALRIRPNHPEVHNNLGNAFGDLGRADEAIAHYRITLQQKPDHADAHNNLGVALAMKGQFDEAIEHFHAAMRYKPNDASAHSNLGNTYGMQGNFDLAIPEYTKAIRLNPKDSQAQNNLAITLFKQGKVDEAISHYRAALELKPNDPQIHYNLGIALLQLGKHKEALGHFSEAVRLKPDYAEAQTQLRALGGAPSQ